MIHPHELNGSKSPASFEGWFGFDFVIAFLGQSDRPVQLRKRFCILRFVPLQSRDKHSDACSVRRRLFHDAQCGLDGHPEPAEEKICLRGFLCSESMHEIEVSVAIFLLRRQSVDFRGRVRGGVEILREFF